MNLFEQNSKFKSRGQAPQKKVLPPLLVTKLHLIISNNSFIMHPYCSLWCLCFCSEITDLAVTILVAKTTFSQTRSEFTYHFWLSVSADICSILIGIMQPLAMWSEEKRNLEYYWKYSS